MKKINLLFISILLSVLACQKKIELESGISNKPLGEIPTANFYYWSAKRKIPLSVDSSIIILQWPSSDSLELKSIIKPENELVKIKDSLFAIKAQNNLFKSAIFQTLTSKAKSVNISFKCDNKPFIPTGEIILMPKPSASIQAILTKYSEEVDLVKRKKYNRYALKSKKFEETIHIANQIYESGLVEWCHPDFIAQIQYFSNATY